VTRNPSSPLSTGCAGVIFEYDVAAILMSRLLRGASVPVGIHEPVARVAFQQSNEGYPLDDVVAWGHADPPAIAPIIQIQVKRRVSATGADAEFIKVMAAAIAACGGQPEQVTSRRLLFGLAARRSGADHLDELTELTDMARAHAESGTFGNLFRPGVTGKPLRDRLGEVSAAVATAAGAPDAFAVKELTHQILQALHVWQVEVGPDGGDWRAELDGLADLAAAEGKSPTDVMAHLCAIAGQFGPRSRLGPRSLPKRRHTRVVAARAVPIDRNPVFWAVVDAQVHHGSVTGHSQASRACTGGWSTSASGCWARRAAGRRLSTCRFRPTERIPAACRWDAAPGL
jgi:hypothetical protein